MRSYRSAVLVCGGAFAWACSSTVPWPDGSGETSEAAQDAAIDSGETVGSDVDVACPGPPRASFRIRIEEPAGVQSVACTDTVGTRASVSYVLEFGNRCRLIGTELATGGRHIGVTAALTGLPFSRVGPTELWFSISGTESQGLCGYPVGGCDYNTAAGPNCAVEVLTAGTVTGDPIHVRLRSPCTIPLVESSFPSAPARVVLEAFDLETTLVVRTGTPSNDGGAARMCP